MLANLLLGKERGKVQDLARQLECNKLHTDREKTQLKTDLLNSVRGPQGLALSFGAGCAAAFLYKNREHLTQFQSLPWNDLLQLVTECGALMQYSQSLDPEESQ